jgi:hypothetical protein
LAWQALAVLCALNGYQREVEPDDAVELMIGVAAVDFDEAAVTERFFDSSRCHAAQHPFQAPQRRSLVVLPAGPGRRDILRAPRRSACELSSSLPPDAPVAKSKRMLSGGTLREVHR